MTKPRRKSTCQQSPLNAASGSERVDHSWRVAGVCLVLAAITFAVFGQTLHQKFINFDDNVYVFENARVTGGLSLKGLAWVFTHADCRFYHPLTMLSLMADYQIYGLHAGGYHCTNVLLHTASVILLFLVLRQMTGALWRSAFVAAVFAIHPLRAESVAWVAERKDVLGSFFFMLTLAAYVRYARKPNSPALYLTVAAAFVLALLSKPTVVTLPFVLLLLDYWPLQRTESVRRLILEKIPLLALAAVVCAVTVMAEGKAVAAFTNVSMPLRLGNAVVSYVVYLRQMIWPEGLALVYPYPQNGLPAWETGLAGMLLVCLSAVALRWWRTQPWLFVGWFCYLGMLTPMIGIIQVGSVAHADRMTYLPQIGIYVALTWLAAEWGAKWHVGRVAIGGIMTAVLGVFIVCAWQQTGYWQNSETLWSHTLACTTDNYIARYNFGNALFEKGRLDQAITQYEEALRIKPDYAEVHENLGITFLQMEKMDDAIIQFQRALEIEPGLAEAHYNLGNALFEKGRVDEAISHYEKALEIKPGYAAAHDNLGNALLRMKRVDEAVAHFQKALEIEPGLAQTQYNLGLAAGQQGKKDEAIACFQRALEIKPGYAEVHNSLGLVLLQKGQVDDAIAHFQKALEIKPVYADACYNLGLSLHKQGRMDEAIAQYQKALAIKPGDANIHNNLGQALLQKGSVSEAIIHFQKALEIEPANPAMQNNLAWLLATGPVASLRNGNKAMELAQQANALTKGQNPMVLRTLAAACAEAGRFGDARENVQKAMALARAAGQQGLAEQLSGELKQYEAGLPLHQ